MKNMGYVITKSGQLKNVSCDTSIEQAIFERIKWLETLVDNGCELKIALADNNTWLAVNYSSTEGDIAIVDEANNHVVAFRNIDKKVLTETLRKANVYFTQ